MTEGFRASNSTFATEWNYLWGLPDIELETVNNLYRSSMSFLCEYARDSHRALEENAGGFFLEGSSLESRRNLLRRARDFRDEGGIGMGLFNWRFRVPQSMREFEDPYYR